MKVKSEINIKLKEIFQETESWEINMSLRQNL